MPPFTSVTPSGLKNFFRKREPVLRRGVMVAAAIMAVYYLVAAAVRPRGDFLVHMEFGRRFFQGEFLYAGGTHIPYPPLWALVHAPLAVLPVNLAMPLVVVLGLAALAALAWMVQDLADPALRCGRVTRFWILAGAILLSLAFITRDLADGGQNLILLMLAWAGLWLFSNGRTLAAAASLGLATALKCTPLAFVVWFAWKRRWGMAALSLGWAAVFSLAPLAVMGPASYVRHMEVWVTNVAQGVATADPSRGVLGEEKFQNKALRPSLARYLMHLPPGHAGRFSGPGYIDILNLSPPTANWVIRMVTISLLVAFGWACRRPMREHNDPDAIWEYAAVGILMVLLSPIAWGQHCVVAFPALYFLVRAWALGDLTAPALRISLVFIAVIFVFTTRFFLGKELSLLLQSSHITTFAMLGLCALTLAAGRISATKKEAIAC